MYFFENPGYAESHNVEWMKLNITEVHIRVEKTIHHDSFLPDELT